mmetsp:Transcript_10416/g.15843  ORF Transcript_10416/g.15843 Transcript_10416/m.15843 type:complete len:247 (-) Transcript_10416:1545-2285(-)
MFCRVTRPAPLRRTFAESYEVGIKKEFPVKRSGLFNKEVTNYCVTPSGNIIYLTDGLVTEISEKYEENDGEPLRVMFRKDESDDDCNFIFLFLCLPCIILGLLSGENRSQTQANYSCGCCFGYTWCNCCLENKITDPILMADGLWFGRRDVQHPTESCCSSIGCTKVLDRESANMIMEMIPSKTTCRDAITHEMIVNPFNRAHFVAPEVICTALRSSAANSVADSVPLANPNNVVVESFEMVSRDA